MNLGELDTLVTLQRNTTTRGAVGQVINTWTDVACVWGKVERNTSEGVDDQNYETDQSLRLTIYKQRDLSTRWRVLVGGKPYEIRGINPGDRTDVVCELQLYAIHER